jgi:tetratricopeptide (TPR) repeat protein
MSPKILGFALLLIRLGEGLKQSEAAARLGILASLLSAYEHGDPRLTPERLAAVVLGLGVPAEEVADRVEIAVFCASLILPIPPVGISGEVSRRSEATAARAGRMAYETARNDYLREARAEQAHTDRRRAEVLWASLKRRSPSARLALVEEVPKYQTWALAERLCTESIRAVAGDPRQVLELAELALQVAERVPGEPAWRSLLTGYVWAFLGNARRVAGDLPSAVQAFREAWKLWEQGAAADCGLLDGSRLLDLEASLLRAQRHFGAALKRLEQALVLNPTGPGRGRILLNKGYTLEQMGSYKTAVVAFQEARQWIDREREPRWYFGLRFNWSACLCHLNRYQEAAEALPELRALTAQPEQAMDRIRVRWLMGRVAGGLGRTSEAVETLAAVRVEFAEKEKAYDEALVSMELAGLYLQQGRSADVKHLVLQMEPVFRAQEVHAEAQKALALFRRAVELESITEELVRRLVAYLYRAQHSPELRFNP